MGPESSVLSVVMPLHREHGRLSEVRSRVHSARSPMELIIVLNGESLEGRVRAGRPGERVVVCKRPGRGYAFACGLAEAKGDITVLLHGDTLLPSGWDRAVLRALSDDRVVGGGFHMSFDRSSGFLDFLTRFSDFQVFIHRPMWGDRALFARTGVLRQCLPALDVPLFEDVRLSKALRRRGRLVILDERVVTSADPFWQNGPYRHTLHIMKARTWYALGGDPRKIYDYYYSR